MTTTADLAPLLDLPPARLEVDGRDGVLPLRHVRRRRRRSAALGRRAADNVVDLLPGEDASRGEGAGVEGWNVVPSALAPDGSAVEGFRFDGERP